MEPGFLLSKLNRCLSRLKCCTTCTYHLLHIHASAHPLATHILYFITISFLGFLLLKALPFKHPQDHHPAVADLDLFFTSVSAATVSSMSTLEMEVFSNSQLLVLTVLMLIGGEVVTSTAGLYFKKTRLGQKLIMAQVEPTTTTIYHIELHQLEIGSVLPPPPLLRPSRTQSLPQLPTYPPSRPPSQPQLLPSYPPPSRETKYKAITYLVRILVGYLVVIHVLGSASIALYVSVISSARDVLKSKNLVVPTFAVFTTVSSFSSCGFIPTNENMVVFRKNSGLLLLVVPLVLLGNTMFPPCMRLVIWVFGKVMTRRGGEYEFLLKNFVDTTGYYHLLPRLQSVFLAATVVVFTAVQIAVICAMEWTSEVFAGMNSYQKFVGALFLSVNSRHTGESVVDLSALSQAVLVLFVIMMLVFSPFNACYLVNFPIA